jgi:Flp pilus assembly pilin Flp
MVTLINNVLLRAYVAAGTLRHRLTEERGQDLLEYALLGGLIAAAIVAAGTFLAMSGALEDMAEGIGRCINFDDLGDPCAS